MHLFSLVIPTFIALSSVLAADATTTQASTATADVLIPTPAASGAGPGQGEKGYSYAGCWNETTGLPGGPRALRDGSMNSNKLQTTSTCLTFCAGNGYQYCGLEYGSECWGSAYFSSLSSKLDEGNCSIGCAANNSQVCGGRLTITLYNMTGADSSGSSGSGSGKKGGASKEVTGVVGAIVLAGLLGIAFSAF